MQHSRLLLLLGSTATVREQGTEENWAVFEVGTWWVPAGKGERLIAMDKAVQSILYFTVDGYVQIYAYFQYTLVSCRGFCI